MRQMLPIGVIIFLCIVMISCNGDTNSHSKSTEDNDVFVSETEAGDYILRLVADKGNYLEKEEVVLKAKLKYIGDSETITIQHRSSPFWFQIRENTRGIDIPIIMDMPLKKTLLENGVWYEEEYTKTGAIEEVTGEDVGFINEFLTTLTFPIGKYEIELNTDFQTMEASGEQKDHKYSTSMTIVVGN